MATAASKAFAAQAQALYASYPDGSAGADKVALFLHIIALCMLAQVS